jgi:hypothetical protein
MRKLMDDGMPRGLLAVLSSWAISLGDEKFIVLKEFFSRQGDSLSKSFS